jgi:hypothetical protein
LIKERKSFKRMLGKVDSMEDWDRNCERRSTDCFEFVAALAHP